MILMLTGFEGVNVEEIGPAGTGATIQNTIKRTGDYALKVNPVTSGLSYRQVNSPSSDGTILGGFGQDCRVQFYLYVSAFPASDSEPILGFSTGSVFDMFLGLRDDGRLELFKAPYTALEGATGDYTVLSTDTWYLVNVRKTYIGDSWDYELAVYEASSGDGYVEVLGNTTEFTGIETGNLGVGKCENKNSQGYEIYIDDLVVTSGTFLAHPFQIECKVPTADGSYTAWTFDYTRLDEVPWSTDARESSTLDAKASVVCGGFTNTASILAVKVNNGAQRGLSGAYLKTFMLSGAAELSTLSAALTASIQCYSKISATDPNTLGAWNLASVNALEVGVTNGAARRAYWHNAQIHVLFGTLSIPSSSRPMIAYNFGG